MKKLIGSTLLATSLAATAVFADVSETIEKGARVKIGKGWAHTYVVYNHKHRPKSVGIAFTEGTLYGLPDKTTSYKLLLPHGTQVPPIKEISIDWNPQGHEPPGTYDLPHFDFHFYYISPATRHAIKCTDEDAPKCTKQPSSDMIAPYYVPTPAGVPMMGWHWLDSRSPELNGEKFTSTFIQGYYNGKMIFMEPMITREFLLHKEDIFQELSLPKKFAYIGWYPKNYVVSHDKGTKGYKVVLKNLKKMD